MPPDQPWTAPGLTAEERTHYMSGGARFPSRPMITAAIRAAERDAVAQVVAWLRAQTSGFAAPVPRALFEPEVVPAIVRALADAVERGEHLEKSDAG